MANLKQDLLNNVGNEKYYAELELARLAQEPNMNYKEKVDKMTFLLKEVAFADLSVQLIGKYFPDQEQANDGAPQQTPQAAPTPEQPQVHPGQSHGE